MFITTQIIAGIMELILAGAIFGRADFFGFGCIALICGVPAALIAIPISLVTAPRSARGAGFAAAAFHVGFLMVMFLVGMNDPRPSMGSGAH